MRTLTIPAALLLATVFATGCSDQKAPTELSEFGPQFNRAPVVFTESFSFDVPNPCTGLLHTNFVDTTARLHEFNNGQKLHFNGHVQFDIVTSDGFSGRAAEHFVDNVDNDGGTSAASVNVNLGNDSHQRIIIHIQFHLTIKNGDVRVGFFEFSSTCVGKP